MTVWNVLFFKKKALAYGMRKTRRKQLVESIGRKTGRKLTRRTEIECKPVE